jgi:hypothetical protein
MPAARSHALTAFTGAAQALGAPCGANGRSLLDVLAHAGLMKVRLANSRSARQWRHGMPAHLGGKTSRLAILRGRPQLCEIREYIGVQVRSAYRKGFGGFMSDISWGYSKDERLRIIESLSEPQVDHVLSFHHSHERQCH